MELSIGLVLTLVTLVTATPHGYGVKGGASAKAEASAVAGSFGDIGPIPLSIPSGAAYSGSFSKSSSSSFASSSASASSSSYSFSGSGANGIAPIGGLGQKGCTTGSCSGIGANGVALNGGHHLGGANAVASAQAKATSGAFTPCHGSLCNNSPAEKCSSGQCQTDSENENENKCRTGNCQSNSESPSKQTGLSAECASGQCEKDKEDGDLNDSNDFPVNINRDSQTKSSQGLNGQYYNKQSPSETSCSNGKCGADNSYSNYYGANKQNQQPVPATYLTTPNHNEPCTTPNCKPSQGYSPQTGGLPSSYNVPIQSATNPPDYSVSHSGTNYGSGNHAYPGQDSKKKNDIPCTSPSCESVKHSTGTYNYQFGQQKPSYQGPCISGRCDIHSDVKPSNNFAVSGIDSPNYSQGGYPSGIPSSHLGKPDCKTPNCAEPSSNQPSQGSSTEPKYNIPTYSSSPKYNQDNNCKGADCSGSPYSGSPTKPSTLDAPVYSGGFGGPAGILDTGVNKFPVNPANQYVPSHTLGFTRPTGPTIEHDSFGTTKPNEFNPNSQYGSNVNSPIGSHGSTGTYGLSGTTIGFDHNKPNSFSPTPSTQFNPAYVNSWTPAPSNAPSGSNTHPINNGVSSNTNDYGGSNTGYTSGASTTGSNTGSSSTRGSFGITKPSPVSPSQSSHTYTGSFGAPTGTIDKSNPTFGANGAYKPGNTNCGPAGCNGNSNTNCGSSGCNAQPGYVDATFSDKTKPNTPSNSQTKPVYTGGFGGPTGSIDESNPTFGPTGGYKPNLGNCGSAGCSGQTDSNSYIGTSSYDTKKPNTQSSSQTTPAYTGGFGGPTGSIVGSSPTSGSTGTYKPGLSNCGPKGCNGQSNLNSNMGFTSYDTNESKAPSSPTNPAYTHSFGGVTGSLDGSSPALVSTGAHKSDSSNCGLNGCSGQPNSNDNLTPYDKTKLSTPSSSPTEPTYSGGFGGPTGLLKPNDFSVPSSSLGNIPCTTGACASKGAPQLNHNQGNSLTSGQSLAAATASANAIAYTGGFGGPPGVLKAYDNGKINGPIHGNSGITSPNHNSQNLGSPSANGKNNLSGNSVESGNGLYSAAHASATATASAGNGGGNNSHQNNIGGSSGCNSGCPNNSNGNGATPNANSSASARSIAGANSFGFGGSFASSSASAHASAGAATKGGYGRK